MTLISSLKASFSCKIDLWVIGYQKYIYPAVPEAMLCDCADVNVEKRTTISDGFIATRSSRRINTQARGRDLVMLAYHSLSRSASAVTLYENKTSNFWYVGTQSKEL